MKNLNVHYFYVLTRLTFSLFVVGIIFSQLATGEENPTTEETTNKTNEPNTSTQPFEEETLALTYYIDNQSLIEDIKYDTYINQSRLETIASGELLILKHLSKTKIKRGNILLLHTDGESANHHRIVRPLAIQMSQLGWNVFIPNIAKEDFKKPKFGTKRKTYQIEQKTNKEEISTKVEEENNKGSSNKQSNSPVKDSETVTTGSDPSSVQGKRKNQHFFETSDKYQAYVKEICEKISSDPDWLNLPRILILNQTSSYWGLSCLSNTKMPTIFLDPQLPMGVKNDLEDIFSNQTSSFYVFYSQMTSNTKMASFSKALSSNKWRSKNQRYSQNILPKGNINIENINLAKRITGWTEKLKKKP